MIFSSARFSAVPFSATENDQSVPSLFSGLIANQDADRAYLLDMSPYDPDTSAEVEVGFSDGITRAVLDGRAWPARLGTVLNSEVNLFSEDIGRGGASSFGVIKIMIGDEDHDEILDYLWDGREVRVLMGADGFAFSQFQPVFVGTAQDIEYSDRELSIIMRDKSELLTLDIQDSTYAGTGGLEGGDDISGQFKPLTYGVVKNIKPVLVDRANLIYQFHDGAAEAVDAAYDGAKALTGAGDVADITATSVTAGQYKTQLSGGYIKLGSEPEKEFTLDAQGDNASSYVSTAADIIQRIVTNHSPLTTDDLNLQSISDTNTANNSDVGWYGNSGSVAEVITALIQSIGGSWVFNRDGELVLGVFQFNSPVGTIEENDIMRLQRVRTPIPTWRRKLGYAKSWTVQGQNDVLPAATDARKDFVSSEFRLAVDEDASIKTRRALSKSIEVNTLLDAEAAANTEVARQQNIFGADRHRFNVVARRQQFKYRAGQTITVNYPRFGFPRDCIILGIVENTNKQLTEFKLFA